ncbi:serine/threonine-protein kinase ATM [Pelomyxa schiedti]|nr:serine/threonine-protein kinase ATM [Pelomyxa schiedti]
MSRTLERVSRYLTTIQTGRLAKERKEALTGLCACIETKGVQQELDSSTDGKLSQNGDEIELPTWDTLISVLLLCANTSPQAKEYPEAIVNVVSKADERGPRLFLCIRELHQRIAAVLLDSESRGATPTQSSSKKRSTSGSDDISKCYLHILEEVSKVPGYCHVMQKETFSKFLQFFTRRLLSQTSEARYVHVFSVLVCAYPFDLMPFTHSLLTFLVDFFDTYPRTQFGVPLMTMLNHIIASCGINIIQQSRECMLKIFPYLLKNFSTSDSILKGNLITFCRTQVRLHREYSGIVTPIKDAESLVEVIISDLNQTRYLSVEAPHLPQLVDLASDLLVQLTKNSQVESDQPLNIKRKFLELQDLERDIREPKVWLQLMTSLLTKYPNLISVSFSIRVLGRICDFMEKLPSDQQDTMDWTLKCLEALAKVSSPFTKQDSRNLATTQRRPSSDNLISSTPLTAANALPSPSNDKSWKHIWRLLLHAPDRALQVMTAIVNFSLIDPTFFVSSNDIWKSAFFTSRPCSDNSLTFLLTFMKCHDLPKLITSESGTARSLRQELISWILKPMIPKKPSTIMEPITGLKRNLRVWPSPKLLSTTLYLLFTPGIPPSLLETSQNERFATPLTSVEGTLSQIEGESRTLYPTNDFRNKGFLQVQISQGTSLNQIPSEMQLSLSGLCNTLLMKRFSRLVLQEQNAINNMLDTFSNDFGRILEYSEADLITTLLNQLLELTNTISTLHKYHDFYPHLAESLVEVINQQNQGLARATQLNPSDALDLDCGAFECNATSLSNKKSVEQLKLFAAILGRVTSCPTCASPSGPLSFMEKSIDTLLDVQLDVIFAMAKALLNLPYARTSIAQKCHDLLYTVKISGDSSFRGNVLEVTSLILASIKLNQGYINQEEECQTIEICSAMLEVLFHLNRHQQLHWSNRKCLAECLPYILFFPNLAQKFQERFLKLFADPDYRVRYQMALSIKPHFTANPESTLFQEIEQALPLVITKCSQEEAITSLLTLADLGCILPSHLGSILFIICSHSSTESSPDENLSNDETMEKVQQAILQHIAQMLEYESIPNLLREYLPELLSRWIHGQKSQPISRFPLFLIGESDIDEFFVSHSTLIVPRLVYSRNESDLLKVRQAHNSENTPTLEWLLKQYFSATFAYVFPLYYIPEEETRAAKVFNFILSKISQKEVNRLIPTKFTQIVLNMFDLMTFSSSEQFPHYPPDSISKALSHLGKDASPSSDSPSIWDKQIANPECFQSIFLHINKKFAVTRRGDEKERLFGVFEFFVQQLGNKVTAASTLRDAIFTSVRFMSCEHLHGRACLLLKQLCELSVEEGQFISTLIPSLISSLWPYIQQSSEIFVDLLSYLVSHPLLQEAILNLNLFDEDLPSLKPYTKKLLHLRGEKVLNDELSLFLSHNQANTHKTEAATLSRLRHLTTLLEKNSNVNNSDAKPLLIDLAWCLIHRSKTASPSILLQISECLGAMGCLDPSILADVGNHVPPINPFPASPILLKQEMESVTRHTQVYIIILKLLDSYLNDDDVSVIDITSNTLKQILKTVSGQEAFSLLDANEQKLLSPFKPTMAVPSPRLKGSGLSSIDTLPIWEQQSSSSYSMWMCNLTAALTPYAFQDEVLPLCGPICQAKLEFAEFLYTPLVFSILETDLSQATSLSLCFRTHLLNSPHLDVISLSLQALDYLRVNLTGTRKEKPSYFVKPFWDKYPEFWIEFDFIGIAQAAVKCSSFFGAVQYVEFHCDKKLYDKSVCLSIPPGDENSINNLLLDIYTNINEPDSISCIPKTHGNVRADIITSRHECNWLNLLRISDTCLESSTSHPPTESVTSLLLSLHNLGQQHLLEFYLKGITVSYPDLLPKISEFQFENAWQRMQWNLDAPLSVEGDYLDFNHAVYLCLRSIHDGDHQIFLSSLKSSRMEIAQRLGRMSHESSKEAHSLFVKLQCLSEVSHIWNIVWGPASMSSTGHTLLPQALKSRPSEEEVESLFSYWRKSELCVQKSFAILEPLLGVRRVFLQILGHEDKLPLMLRNHAVLARGSSCFSTAFNLLHQANALDSTGPHSVTSVIEECKILWHQGELNRAIEILKSIENSPSLNESILAKVLYNIGKWTAQTRAERGQIIEDYLQRSVQLLQHHGSNVCKACFRLAQFCDEIHQNFIDQTKSPEWETQQNLRTLKEQELEKLNSKMKNSDQTIQRHIHVLERQVELDRQETARTELEKAKFLRQAVLNYINSLKFGDKYDISSVFRLCSLWFFNTTDDQINLTMKSSIPQIQSRKFIPLIYQIASRLSLEKNEFQSALQVLLERCSADHPHHTLWQLFALAHGDRRQKQDRHHIVDQDKVSAANAILNHLPQAVSGVLSQMRLLITAYIDLASLDFKGDSKPKVQQPIPLPSNIRVPPLHSVAVPTVDTPLDPHCRYSDIISVDGFEKTFTIPGGINLPRCIICRGSNGVGYKQLVKGTDDLRQDAVMEQLFQMVNVLLTESHETRKRNLKIRTYKVVPLTPTSGFLEWVNNTIPIGEYLVGSSREPNNTTCAHVRFHPNDWRSAECRKKLSANARGYKEICDHFKPVFHHFFQEFFSTASQWFEKQISYTRSVASNSIIGYIVGLGDRHAQNILVDKSTAELVHIDLGVAFEQGKTLNTPELVPFRLTRDIVDGMGVSGTEGVFRRCCEETMRVLHLRHQALLTILEVFIHDPLYRWALDPLAAHRRQGDSEEDSPKENTSVNAFPGNRDAERALFRLKLKLQALEYGDPLSVEGQVTQLIIEAKDPQRLGKMYPGWAPWV